MNKKSFNLSQEKKDKYLEKLLIFMKNQIEQVGTSVYARVRFQFKNQDETPAGEDRIEFLSKNKITNKEFDMILNYAITFKFIEPIYLRMPYNQMVITDEGMDRAISVERATYKSAVADSTSITFNGPVNATNLQAGNNNVQNINNTFYYLIDEIKKSDASEEEKKTALTKLKDFLSNPIVSGVTSNCVTEIIKSLTGMGI